MTEGLSNALTALVSLFSLWMIMEVVYKALSLFSVIRGEFRRKELEDKIVNVIGGAYAPRAKDKDAN